MKFMNAYLAKPMPFCVARMSRQSDSPIGHGHRNPTLSVLFVSVSSKSELLLVVSVVLVRSARLGRLSWFVQNLHPFSAK